MKRHIPGLHSRQQDGDRPLEGLFLVRVEWASYRWHPQKAFLLLRFVVLEPKSFERRSFSGRLYSTERALWKLNWFLRDFGYDMELLSQDQIDEKALINLRGVVQDHTRNPERADLSKPRGLRPGSGMGRTLLLRTRRGSRRTGDTR